MSTTQKRQVKICGLKTIEMVDVAIDNKADFIGLVFFPPSPRNVSIDQAIPLAQHGRGKTKIVALVVDADDELLRAISEQVKPDFIQAHGSETPQRIGEIKALTRLPIIKAIKVRQASDVETAGQYKNIADIILFDAKAPDTTPNALPGGNGIGFDWSLLKQTTPPKGFMLSGGLNLSNIGDAVTLTDAAFFDVSSGVESSPGEKDAALIKNFIETMRAAS